jgi:hypothetical protein
MPELIPARLLYILPDTADRCERGGSTGKLGLATGSYQALRHMHVPRNRFTSTGLLYWLLLPLPLLALLALLPLLAWSCWYCCSAGTAASAGKLLVLLALLICWLCCLYFSTGSTGSTRVSDGPGKIRRRQRHHPYVQPPQQW